MRGVAFVGVLMANGPLVTDAHAGQPAGQRSAKVPYDQHPDRKLTDSLSPTTVRGSLIARPQWGAGGMLWRVREPAVLEVTTAPWQTPRPAGVSVTPSTGVRARRQTPGRRSGGSLGTFAVRAYTHYHRPGQTPNRTATGTVPVAGRTVAVDPRVIPLGTKIHIEGVGERIAEDTGGKVKGKALDLFLPSVRACRQFGVQHQEVHVLR
jgi:3D (Asp-Asp-Asp) domain-containing protein